MRRLLPKTGRHNASVLRKYSCKPLSFGGIIVLQWDTQDFRMRGRVGYKLQIHLADMSRV
jgi:hypothetical protein